ncbi:PEP-utilizing enzyme [bacterium]|nr:PEP-utilizing enzyme [bacterium]
MSLGFSTKAGTLASLQGVLKSARIAPLRSFTVADWQAHRQACQREVTESLGTGPWIVRSSCGQEDGVEVSNAGAFLSVPKVDAEGLPLAVDQVIAAYGEVQPADEVLIQPMLTNVLRSGVAFSHDPNTCAPYRVINWMEGGDTTAVTSGLGGKTWQHAANSPVCLPDNLSSVSGLIEELLSLFGGTPVDCEFAVTSEGKNEVLWLLQARPLILKRESDSAKRQTDRLSAIYEKVERGMRPHPFLRGKTTVYGVMPDWNPAEIIGVRPKPLALSLYRELITDSIWAYQRHNYGYRNLRSFPLMPHFFGLPYIDVRLSFNSFIPSDLEESLADRLVDYYIDRLLEEPALHDKVEFEVVYSCYTLDLPQRLERLAQFGFTKEECQAIADSLRNLTNRIVNHKEGLWRQDTAKLDTLNTRREELLASGADSLERIYWLLEDTKRYGTLPFAGLARAGFVAVQMLRSLVAVGVFSKDDFDSFIGGICTVSGQLARDRKTMDKSTFLSQYGHLRPGTYDILSPRYDAAPELYFDWSQLPSVPEPVSPFSVTLPQIREVTKLLKSHGLQSDPGELFDFLEAGVELRELAKFDFTRNLSDMLELIAQFGAQWDISRGDLAYCDINVFKELHIAAENPEEVLLRSIDRGKLRYQETLAVSLPPLIVSPQDVWAFDWPEAAPNFITQRQATGHVVSCDELASLAGGLVCIPSADPGFDWLFSHPIAGLITAWGGANSHMAIRAAELGLPAVIGAGEAFYRRWSSAQRLHLDCAGRRVEVLA